MKPYKNATDPPEGRTIDRLPARQIQVLYFTSENGLERDWEKHT
jgi:hypothetical protein